MNPSSQPSSADTASTPARRSRRDILRLAGVAAAGGAAATAIGSQPALAVTATPILMGAVNDASSAETELLSAVTSGSTFWARNSGSGVGVSASSMSGTALIAYSTTGIGAYISGGRAQLMIQPGSDVPTPGDHSQGEIGFDPRGLWVCVTAGNPGVWQNIAGPYAAGGFHPISPTRVYDSRAPFNLPSNPLSTGQTRTLHVCNMIDTAGIVEVPNIVPAGATAVTYTLTVTGTHGSGYLTVNEAGNTTATASTINWSAAGQTIANTSVVMLGGDREVTVICGGTGASCNFIIDVVGYYR